MANFDRGLLQAHVAIALGKFHVTAKSSPESKEKAIAAAQKLLKDKDDARARQITNYMLRNYSAKEIAERRERLKGDRKVVAKKATAKARTGVKKPKAKAATPVAAPVANAA